MDIEVRCCCNPNKIYGTLDTGYLNPHYGLEIKYRYADMSGPKCVTLTACKLSTSYESDDGWRRRTIVAFKKPHELPLEDLRKIKEFKENPYG